MEAENAILNEEEMNDPVTETENTAESTAEGDTQAELEGLREQVRMLTEELRARAAFADKIAAQLGEFGELFPDVSMESVPESVWDSVRAGSSLASAYAIYARRAYINEMRAGGINKRNAELSAGLAGKGTASEYYTPDEVRAMSQREVRANYSKIVESMKKWN
jgi:hypothetical protein